jgi:hypothetical protein
VLEQVRLALGALAHAEEALVGAVARREHEVRADEDVDLADDEIVGRPSSTVCRTANSVSPYSSIFGRWWPWRASSTARSCRPNSRCIFSSSSAVASLSATQTKQRGRLTYSPIGVDRASRQRRLPSS